jgi:hypothetical protein
MNENIVLQFSQPNQNYFIDIFEKKAKKISNFQSYINDNIIL